MKIADALSGVTRLFLDTAPVNFFVERHLQDYPHVTREGALAALRYSAEA